MNSYVLIDGNNILKAGYKEKDPNRWHMVGYFFDKIQELKIKNPNSHLIVLWDSKKNWRYKVESTYKENRKIPETPEIDKEKEARRLKKIKAKELQNISRDFIKKILSFLPVYSIEFENYEADDLAAMIVNGDIFNLAKCNLRLYSADEDWLQLVREGVVWQSTRTNITVSLSNFYSYTGFKNPSAFLESKLLKGDSGDNVKGINGLGEVSVKLFFDTYSSINEYYSLSIEERQKKWLGKKNKGLEYLNSFSNKEAALSKQIALMDLNYQGRPKLEHDYLPKLENIDLERTKQAFRKCGLTNLYLDFDNFKRIIINGIS